MPGKVFIQILGTNSRDYSSSIFVFTDNRRYLFNAGEGICRFALERAVKLVKITDFFFSECAWESTAGFADLLFNIDGAVDLDVVGPPNLIDSLLCTRFFLHLPKKCLHLEEYGGSVSETRRKPPGADDLTVVPVYVCPDDAPRARTASKRMTINLAYDTWGTRKQPEPSPVRLSFILETPSIAGKFDAKKAKALGIELGPKCGQLQRGEPVTLADGRVVKPDDVIGPPTKGAIVLLLFCPSMSYVSNLASAPEIVALLESPQQLSRIQFVFHTTPAAVFESAAYRSLVAKFQANTKHIVLNEEYCPSRVASPSTALNHAAFNLVSSDFFPPLYFNSAPVKDLAANITPGELMMKVELQPKCLIDRTDVIENLDTSAQEKLLRQSVEWSAQVDELHSACVHLREAAKTETDSFFALERLKGFNENVCVYFLGTSAAAPVQFRNVSGIYVEFPFGGILLDCGEGTLGQMYRLFGNELAKKILNLKIVFLTHHHADHFCGVTRVLSYRNKLNDNKSVEPIVVIGDPPIQNWLREYSATSEKLQYKWLMLDALHEPKNELSALTSSFGLTQFQSVAVQHCWFAHGLVLTYKGAFKLVYSGDTMESKELIALGKDCTLLIHEATFENGWQEMAKKKRHSTTEQALAVAKSMNAARTVLTHFSSRYSYEWPAFDAAEHRDVFVAFDMLRIPITYFHLKTMPKLLSSLHTTLLLVTKQTTPKPMEIDTKKRSSSSGTKMTAGGTKNNSPSVPTEKKSTPGTAASPSAGIVRETTSDEEDDNGR